MGLVYTHGNAFHSHQRASIDSAPPQSQDEAIRTPAVGGPRQRFTRTLSSATNDTLAMLRQTDLPRDGSLDIIPSDQNAAHVHAGDTMHPTCTPRRHYTIDTISADTQQKRTPCHTQRVQKMAARVMCTWSKKSVHVLLTKYSSQRSLIHTIIGRSNQANQTCQRTSKKVFYVSPVANSLSGWVQY